MDMLYDFFIKHNKHAVEWKLKVITTKNKNLLNKSDQICRHPLKKN